MGIFSRPRVLCFFHETTWSGAPIQLWHLISALRRRRYRVSAAVPKLGAPEAGPITTALEEAGIEVFPLVDLSTPPELDALRALCRRFDVVIANTLVMRAAVQAAHAEGVPVIWYIHESRVAESLLAQNPEMQPALEMADRLVMPTRRTSELYAPFTKRAIDVVPYGIPEVASPAGEKASSEKKTFLLLGSYERRKGQDVFLEAIALIPEAQREGGIFCAAGRVLEPEFFASLEERAAALPEVGLGGALEHEEALRALGRAGVLVCASRDETMPIAILEAMSLGKAIISTDAGGIAEWLNDGVNALLVPAENRAALAQALTRCLTEPELVRTLGEKARQTFKRDFALDRLGKNFARLIEEVRRKR